MVINQKWKVQVGSCNLHLISNLEEQFSFISLFLFVSLKGSTILGKLLHLLLGIQVTTSFLQPIARK